MLGRPTEPLETPMARTQQDEQRQVERVCVDLVQEYAESLPARVVEEQFIEVLAGLRQAPVRDYVPTLVHRGTRERLRRLV